MTWLNENNVVSATQLCSKSNCKTCDADYVPPSYKKLHHLKFANKINLCHAFINFKKIFDRGMP